MLENLAVHLPPVFAVAAAIYLALAVRVARFVPDSLLAFLLFLTGCMVAGGGFSVATGTGTMHDIGRVLTLFAAGFIPVTFYAVYREYTSGRPSSTILLALSMLPVVTTVIALTNPVHEWLWSASQTSPDIVAGAAWFIRLHMTFSFGLMAYSAIALTGRLTTIARAHRQIVTVLLAAASLPFIAAASRYLLGTGPTDFPITAAGMILVLPLFTYVSLSLQTHRFSPLAYPIVFDHVRDALIVLDVDDQIVCANRAAQALLEASESELLGKQLWSEFPEAREAVREAKSLDLTQTVRFRRDRTFEVSVAPLTSTKGIEQGTVVVFRDVTERRKSLEKLAQNEQLIRTLIETSSNGILRLSRDLHAEGRAYRCIFANRSAEIYLESQRGALVGMSLAGLAQLDPDKLTKHFDCPSGEKKTLSFERSVDSASGRIWLRIVVEPVDEDFSVTLIDITQRKHNEDKMLAEALRDPLTGVLNRRGFEKEAGASIREHETGAVIYLDLNQFKSINDRFGHRVGDVLLKAFGHRLNFCLRPQDLLGRLGGDEFAIVLPGVDVQNAKQVAGRLVQTASEAYIIQGQEIQCSASVGIALMPRHGEELWHLLSVADEAMYAVKSVTAQDAANDRSAYIDAATAS